MDVAGRNIYVGLSGGVDSAVSAALLVRAGARVTGVFIKGWYPPALTCTWADDRQDAMRVAAHLHIPFHTLDASAEYKKEVIEYLLAEYAAGRTPNPDVMCNREVKFGAFYRHAMLHGADAIAMGHYRSGEKDQNYFLALVPKDALAKTVFPVGHMSKADVRALAETFGLPVARKKDSQGVCFLGSVSVKEFLEQELGSDAARLHTIGERIDGQYVIGKEAGKLQLGDKAALERTAGSVIAFRSANWILATESVNSAQYRYRGPRIKGRVEGNRFIATEPLSEPTAPGQLVAFYKDELLAGGGIIDANE